MSSETIPDERSPLEIAESLITATYDWQSDAILAVADALLAAEQRGRKAGLEEAAEVAAKGIKMPGGDVWAKGYRCASADIEVTVSAAIRSLGEKI